MPDWVREVGVERLRRDGDRFEPGSLERLCEPIFHFVHLRGRDCFGQLSGGAGTLLCRWPGTFVFTGANLGLQNSLHAHEPHETLYSQAGKQHGCRLCSENHCAVPAAIHKSGDNLPGL